MRQQTPYEEKLNAISHGIGALFGITALVLLIVNDTEKNDWSLFSILVYGISIIILFSASAVFHIVKGKKRKHYFRIVDHISIYLLIAGTYTPLCLISLVQSKGWVLFFIVWGIATFGVVIKLFFTGRFEVFSTLLYLVMGWLVVLDFSNVSNALGSNGLLFLFGGGLAYTVGIVFYAIDKIPFNHVIWHIFVLVGAISHFFMTLFYVI